MLNTNSIIDFVVSIGPLCVPAELLKNNGVKKESFIFDWCHSNPRCVIDVIKNGAEWHIENNIKKRKIYDTHYEFKGLKYTHRSYDIESDIEYMKRCCQRFFKLLYSPTRLNVIFLHMSNNYDAITNSDLDELVKILQEKAPNINFKIVMANYFGNGDNIKLIEDSTYYTKYACLSPKEFHSNHMIGEYYTKLFKTILPFTFNIKQINDNKMYTQSPYRQIPKELLPTYTQNFKIPILMAYHDDSKNKNASNFSESGANLCFQAFVKYNIRNKNVGIIGSPWLAANLSNLGNRVTTDFITTQIEYDCIVAYSSLEHLGLGRYGDPLDPDGDLKAMKEIFKHLKPNGLCILGIPVGRDCLVWNAHRIYGNTRLPLLCEGFQELEWLGYNKNLLELELCPNAFRPILVLKKPGSTRPFRSYNDNPNNVLVESGSYLGDGIKEAINCGFKKILSYEISPAFYAKVVARFDLVANVLLYQKPSQTMFDEIKYIEEPMTFWLDGHYMIDNPQSSFHQVYCPILFELDEIAKHSIKTHTLLINGVQFFGKWDYQFITEKEVREKILSINPKYKFKYEDDVLVAYTEKVECCPTCCRPL